MIINQLSYRCLGSTQHLKNLYGAGYTLEIKLKHYDESWNSTSLENINLHIPSEINTTKTSHNQIDRVQALRNFVVDLFPDACIEEIFADRLVYSVPQHAVSSLAQCFSSLEKGKYLTVFLFLK